MKNFYSSIILFVVAFVAVVGFAPQARALDVAGPSRTECLSDLQCMRGQTCVLGECVTSCSTDADCPVVEECFKGTCISTACETSTDCSDGLFCNGAETCFKPSKLLPGTCVVGTAPCAGEICVEAEDECIECEIDEDCAEDETCEANVCEDPCPYPSEAKALDLDGNCSFSKEELKEAKAFYKEEHKGQKNDLKESQGADKELLKSLKEYAE